MAKTDDDDAVLRDGQTKRVSMMMMDSHRPGYRFTDDAELQAQQAKNQEAYAYHKAAMQAEWRGGLVQGDIVDIGGRLCSVEGRDEKGAVLLRAHDAQTQDSKELAYAQLVHDLTHAWETE